MAASYANDRTRQWQDYGGMETGMDWQIHPFERVGPIRFGMTVSDVEAILGVPERTRKGLRPGSHAEFRGTSAPIIRYRDGEVCEIEAFYDLPGVSVFGMDLFGGNGLKTMRTLEKLNGGAVETVGIVLFDTLGITTGRLDQKAREDHSITAFRRGLWNGKKDDLKAVSFG